MADGQGGSRKVVQSPYRFSAAASGLRGRAPHQGEHNREVVGRWLHASPAELASWEQSGVLLAPKLSST